MNLINGSTSQLEFLFFALVVVRRTILRSSKIHYSFANYYKCSDNAKLSLKKETPKYQISERKKQSSFKLQACRFEKKKGRAAQGGKVSVIGGWDWCVVDVVNSNTMTM
jgi:hypothetical protein